MLERLWSATAATTTTNRSRSTRPIWSRNTNCTCAWAIPMTMPAASARGNETMPPMTAAASARIIVFGPRLARPVIPPRFPDSMINEMLESAPPTVQTKSDTNLGSMPESRARSALPADACTVWPKTVRLRNQARAIVINGTVMRITSLAPVIRRPNTSSQVVGIATGKRTPRVVSKSG